MKLLLKGSKGEDVKTLQIILINNGYNLGKYGADGHYGQATYNAVIEFQKKNKLNPDGIVGNNTWNALNQLSNKQTKTGIEWLDIAKTMIGIDEINNEKDVHQMWKDAKLSGLAKFPASKIPWCSGFACACMERAKIRSPRADSARSWLQWGIAIYNPVDGCVVVFSRKGGGHVGFVVGEADNGNLLVIGGNQGNSVNIKEFTKDRVVGYRLPIGYDVKTMKLSKGGKANISNNEQ